MSAGSGPQRLAKVSAALARTARRRSLDVSRCPASTSGSGAPSSKGGQLARDVTPSLQVTSLLSRIVAR
jgi:hypothetical protein